MSLLVAIEGISCAGKTTLCKNLAEQRISVVPEYGVYTSSFPAQAKTPEELIANFNFFADLEAQRYADAQKLLAKGEQVVVMDRSYLTCCAHDYAALHATALLSKFPKIERLWELWEEKIIPDLVIVLSIRKSTFNKRLRDTGRRLKDPLADWGFNEKFYSYLRQVHARWGVECITINADYLSESEVIQEFNSKVKRS